MCSRAASRTPRVIGSSCERSCAVNRGVGWAQYGHTRCPYRSILVNHNRCHSAAQCRFDSQTSTPKRVRFPADPLPRLERFYSNLLSAGSEATTGAVVTGTCAGPASPRSTGVATALRRARLAVLTRGVRYPRGGWLAAECGVAAVVIIGVQPEAEFVANVRRRCGRAARRPIRRPGCGGISPICRWSGTDRAESGDA